MKEINKAIDEFEEFLLCDLDTKIFPMDRVTGRTMFRQDFFQTKKDVHDYIEEHFRILRENIKETISEKEVNKNK